MVVTTLGLSTFTEYCALRTICPGGLGRGGDGSENLVIFETKLKGDGSDFRTRGQDSH